MESLVRTFASELLRPRRYNYSQQPLEEFLLVNSDVQCSNFRIVNNRNHLLETILLKKGSNSTCILYAHGLGSNKLEGLSIAKYFLKQGFDVCSFDFSGSGRSEGDLTTYGFYEKDDLLAVIRHLQITQNYDKIVLWGRSMGAVSVILAQQQQQNSKVGCLILDSPFCSFEQIALEIAAKKSFVPQFMLSMLMQPLKQYFTENDLANPFLINIQKALQHIDCPILLIYSENDSIVSCTHSKKIVSQCKKNPKEIVIDEDHNMQRSKSTLHKTLKFITDSARQAERKVLLSRSKNRGISVTSKGNKERESIRSVSKIKLCHPSAAKLTPRVPSSSKISQRHIHTIATIVPTLNTSVQYGRKRIQTEYFVQTKKKEQPYSVFVESKIPVHRLSSYANKENIKPSLNLMRKNRFR